MFATSSFSNQRVWRNKKRLTKRAADWWDSSRLTSIFLASSFSCSRSESQPVHQRLTQTVRRLSCKSLSSFFFWRFGLRLNLSSENQVHFFKRCFGFAKIYFLRRRFGFSIGAFASLFFRQSSLFR